MRTEVPTTGKNKLIYYWGGRKVMTEELNEFIDYCYLQLEEKQDKLSSEYGVGNCEQYWYSQKSKTLQFKNEGKVIQEFCVVFIGSWSPISNTWMWSWANSSMTDEVRQDSSKIKELSNAIGLDFFEVPIFRSNEDTISDLVAMSVEHLEAIGMYKAPSERSNLFMAIMGKN